MGLLLLILIAILLLWLIGAAGLVYALGHPKRKTFAVALGRGEPTDPADLELEGQEVTFTFTDHSRTPGWVIEGGAGRIGIDASEGGDPQQLRSLRLEREDRVSEDTVESGPTIVIVHGFGDSRYGALTRAPLLLDHARKVVVFDMPGQGESEAKHGYGGLREPDDLLTVLGQLEPDDARRIVLLGVSMGGGVAIAAAAKAEGELRQSIVGVIAEGPYRYWDDPLHNMFRRKKYPRWPIIPLAGLWLRLTAKGFKDFDRAGHAAGLACPLLVLHGSEDELCPIDTAKQIADAAANAQFVEIEGGGHSDLPSGHEPAYRAAVADFLKMLCQTPGSGKM